MRRRLAKTLVSEDTLRKALDEANNVLADNPQLESELKPLIDGIDAFFQMPEEDAKRDFLIQDKSQLLDDEVAPDFVEALKADVQSIADIVRQYKPQEVVTGGEEKEAAGFMDDVVKNTVTYLRQNKQKLKNLLDTGGQVKLEEELKKIPAGSAKGSYLTTIVDGWLNGVENDNKLVMGLENLFKKSSVEPEAAFDQGEKDLQMMGSSDENQNLFDLVPRNLSKEEVTAKLVSLIKEGYKTIAENGETGEVNVSKLTPAIYVKTMRKRGIGSIEQTRVWDIKIFTQDDDVLSDIYGSSKESSLSVTAADMAMLSDDEVLEAYAAAEEEIEAGDMNAYQDLKACEAELAKRGLGKTASDDLVGEISSAIEKFQEGMAGLLANSTSTTTKEVYDKYMGLLKEANTMFVGVKSKMESGKTSSEEGDEDPTYTTEPVEAYGVRGMKSTPWRRDFKSRKALNDWVEKAGGDIEVQGIRKKEGSLKTAAPAINDIDDAIWHLQLLLQDVSLIDGTTDLKIEVPKCKKNIEQIIKGLMLLNKKEIDQLSQNGKSNQTSSLKTAAPQIVSMAKELEYKIKDLILSDLRPIQKKVADSNDEEIKKIYSKLEDALLIAHGLSKQGLTKISNGKKESTVEVQVEAEPKESSKKAGRKSFTACMNEMNYTVENGGFDTFLDQTIPEEIDYLAESLPVDMDMYPNLSAVKELLFSALNQLQELEGTKYGSFKEALDHGRADAPDSNTSAHADNTDAEIESFFKEQDAKYASLDSASIFTELSKYAAEVEIEAMVDGPVAERQGGTIENAIEFIMQNVDNMENATVADVQNALVAAGYTIQVAQQAIEETMGKEALLVLSSPIAELVK